MGELGSKGVEARRAVIGLGANLGDRLATIDQAIVEIERVVGPIFARSRVIETEPLNPNAGCATSGRSSEQPAYLNGVIGVETDLSPEDILRQLLSIERSLGRVRSGENRWESRVIDLDLICMEGETVLSPFLVLPHPEMHRRRFVLEPMLEVCPEWVHPVFGKNTRELLHTFSQCSRSR